MDRQLSVVVPCYNEANTLIQNLGVYQHLLRTYPQVGELIFVDDGSTDDTRQLIKRLQKHFPTKVKLLTHPKNLGKGAAVRRGMLEGRGRFLLFMDADLSTSISHIPLFYHLGERFDIVIGVRRKTDSQILVRQPWYREALGGWYTRLANFFFLDSISDVTCGFKLFNHSVARTIFGSLKLERWSFDTEVLYLAKIHQFTVKQQPVRWKYVSSTKVRLFRDVLISSFELLLLAYYKTTES